MHFTASLHYAVSKVEFYELYDIIVVLQQRNIHIYYYVFGPIFLGNTVHVSTFIKIEIL